MLQFSNIFKLPFRETNFCSPYDMRESTEKTASFFKIEN